MAPVNARYLALMCIVLGSLGTGKFAVKSGNNFDGWDSFRVCSGIESNVLLLKIHVLALQLCSVPPDISVIVSICGYVVFGLRRT